MNWVDTKNASRATCDLGKFKIWPWPDNDRKPFCLEFFPLESKYCTYHDYVDSLDEGKHYCEEFLYKMYEKRAPKYKIKSLEWSNFNPNFHYLPSESSTRFGTYYIGYNLSGWDYKSDPEGYHTLPLYLRYCFSEYYDEGEFFDDSKTIDQWKEFAQNHWEEELKKCLYEI